MSSTKAFAILGSVVSPFPCAKAGTLPEAHRPSLNCHRMGVRVVDHSADAPDIVLVGRSGVRRHDEIEPRRHGCARPVVLRAFIEDETARDPDICGGGPAERAVPGRGSCAPAVPERLRNSPLNTLKGVGAPVTLYRIVRASGGGRREAYVRLRASFRSSTATDALHDRGRRNWSNPPPPSNSLIDMQHPDSWLSWRYSRARAGGGATGDLGSHHIDQARFLVGEVRRVHAMVKSWSRDAKGVIGDVNDDWFVAGAELDNGVTASFEASRVAEGDSLTGRIEVDGTKGTLRWEMERVGELYLSEPGRGTRRTMTGHRIIPHDSGCRSAFKARLRSAGATLLHQAYHMLAAAANGAAGRPVARPSRTATEWRKSSNRSFARAKTGGSRMLSFATLPPVSMQCSNEEEAPPGQARLMGRMMEQSLIEAFGRRVRVGMVGGGRPVIGSTHVVAMRVDGLCELTAGAMSVDPDIAIASGRRELLAPDRIYTDYREMAEKEAARSDCIDAVVIATPPRLHFPVTKAFLEKGIDVICEKPMTHDLTEAEALVVLVRRSGKLFCLTHCYTGYPMVREARALVKAGAIGKVRLIDAEFSIGAPASRWSRTIRPSVIGDFALTRKAGPGCSAKPDHMPIT